MDHNGRRYPVRVFAVAALAASLTGCSLFVMAGKMLLGNPTITSPFEKMTGVNLREDDKRILVVCTTPATVAAERPSLKFDLVDGMTRQMRQHEIPIVDPDKVATWLDNNAGYWEDPSELARAFDTDYIAHVEMNRFRLQEKNSASMLRGRAGGNVVVYEVQSADGEKQDGEKRAVQVFVQEFSEIYPELYPASKEEVSPSIFGRRFVDRLSSRLARIFHDYRMNNSIE